MSIASFEFITPSPSQSSIEVTCRVILFMSKEQLFEGFVLSFTISPNSLTPSPSQSKPSLDTITEILLPL